MVDMSSPRVCVVRRGLYPIDPRLHRHVRALLDAGYQVDLICEWEPGSPRRERAGRLRIRRVTIPPGVGGPARLVLHYAVFFVAATVLLTLRHLRRRYELIHVESLPDVLVFAGVVPRLLGARILLDLSECWPEYWATRFHKPAGHPVLHLLGRLEQASIRFADSSLTCTEQMREAFVARGADPDQIGVVVNGSDECVFDVRRYHHQGSPPGEFVLISHGALEPRYGLDTVIRALHILAQTIPGLRLELYGSGTHIPELQRLARELGVADRVWFSHRHVPIRQLLAALSRADAGVVAVHRDSFRDLTHCNKMFDFIAMHVPVLITRARSVLAYFDEDCFEFFESRDPEDLARAIRRLHDDPERRSRRVQRALEAAEPYRWAHQREVYIRTVRRLLGEDPVQATTTTPMTTGATAHSAVER